MAKNGQSTLGGPSIEIDQDRAVCCWLAEIEYCKRYDISDMRDRVYQELHAQATSGRSRSKEAQRKAQGSVYCVSMPDNEQYSTMS